MTGLEIGGSVAAALKGVGSRLAALASDAIATASRLRGRYVVQTVDEEPDEPRPRTLYVVGEGDSRWFGAFACPCGCGQTLKVSLLPDERPRWSATRHWDGTASLSPSVWRQVGCKSHFWMRRGRVDWC